MVQYTYSRAADLPADVIPLIPTEAGEIIKSGLNVTFPDYGAGLWVISARGSNNMDIGTVEISPGISINLWMGTSATFVSSQTPLRLSGGHSANRTLDYVFYAMGSWG